MNGRQFIRKIRKLGRTRQVEVRVVKSRGKGSHVVLYYGSRFTTVKDRKKDLSTGLLAAMLEQLGLGREDLE
jgi:mRNA interferase HicA